jgi:hypothetical protein
MRWALGAGLLLGGMALFTAPAGLNAADEVPKDVKEAILKIADLLEKGKTDDAKKEAQALAKKQGYDPAKDVGGFKDPMTIFKPKSKGGLGIGGKGDGIEATIITLGKGTKSKLGMDDLKKAAYVTLAIAEITAASPPTKNGPKKKVADWEKWAKDMEAASQDLIKAIEKKDNKGIATSAKNLDGNCSECHQVFRPSS